MQPADMEQPINIRTLFASARRIRRQLDELPDSSNSAFQEKLRTAITSLDECQRLADEVSLFSPNESLDDISSGDIEYLLIDYYLGDLTMKDNVSDRKGVLRRAQMSFNRFLHLLDQYGMLAAAEQKLYERFAEGRDEFSLMTSNDAATRRDVKIKRYKQENELKLKLEFLGRVPHALQGDDQALRELFLAEIELSIHRTFYALDMIAQELKILALVPMSVTPDSQPTRADQRQRMSPGQNSYSERLDGTQLLNKNKAGPILDKNGKPLKPFTILGNRQALRNGVFKPDHNLPTMTIDEYLDEEKRRGGMIEGGGEQSGIAPEPDEDNMEKADVETMKAREWDEFTEANPKGSGNTINRG